MNKLAQLYAVVILCALAWLSYTGQAVAEEQTQEALSATELLSKDQPLPVNDRILSLLEQIKESPEQAQIILPKIEAISENFNFAEQYLMVIAKAKLADEQSRGQAIDRLLAALAMEEKMAKSQLSMPEFSDIHFVLADLYVANKQYQLAYEQKKLFMDKYRDYRKQIREQRLRKLNEKYETDLKVKENELLESQHELQALKLREADKKSLVQRRNMAILAVTAIIFFILLLRQFRIRSILRDLSKTDSLTGLDNRRTLFDQGENLLRQAKEQAAELSVIMFDIDHFKQINDNYGHDVGDDVICAVATLGKETMRARDVFSRLGGEEFAAVLPATSLDQAKAIAERFREKVEQFELSAHDNYRLSMSAGVVTLTDDYANFEALLHAADEAMYQAKAAGRNQVQCVGG